MSDQRRAAMQLMLGAMMAADSEQYNEALQMLDYAIRLVPDDGELYHNRGMVYRYMERYDEAVSDFNRALALAPHPSSYEQRGLVYVHLGDEEAARLDWEQAVALNPSSAMALGNLAHLAYLKGQYQMALDYLARGIESEPDLAQFYATRAEVYMAISKPELAFADMQRANYLIEHNRDTSDRAKYHFD